MFDKNIEFIDNLALKRRLMRISPIESKMGISYCVTPSNDYVLLKNDIPADDLNNPREAVKKNLKNNIKSEMKSNDFIINFGIGLGYLLDETFNTYPSKILIYEPDLNLLHFVLHNVDISEHLSSGRVFITNDLDELINKLSTSFLSKDKVEIVYLQNYATLKNQELLLLTQRVYDTCKSKIVDINTITRFSKQWLNNSLDNIKFIKEKSAYLLSDLENKFAGQTALILAPGPSLKDNIEKVKENRNKFVIFAVNKVAKYLAENNIIPDFLVCLDAGNMDWTLSGLDNYLAQVNCIMDIRSDKSLFSKNFKKIFINFSETDFLMKKMQKYNDMIKPYEIGGTAASLALVSAIKMGFSKIVLSGLDLAFKDGLIYSYGEMMNRISPEQIIVDKIKKNIVQVKSVNGRMVSTREDYEAFIYHFASLIKELEYSEIYNTTSFGAMIPGVKTANFDDLIPTSNSSTNQLDFVEPFNLKLEDFMQDEFLNINNIISKISKNVFSPELISSIIKSALIYEYMQAKILIVLQKNFDEELAENFITETKNSIKFIVEKLQTSKLI